MEGCEKMLKHVVACLSVFMLQVYADVENLMRQGRITASIIEQSGYYVDVATDARMVKDLLEMLSDSLCATAHELGSLELSKTVSRHHVHVIRHRAIRLRIELRSEKACPYVLSTAIERHLVLVSRRCIHLSILARHVALSMDLQRCAMDPSAVVTPQHRSLTERTGVELPGIVLLGNEDLHGPLVL